MWAALGISQTNPGLQYQSFISLESRLYQRGDFLAGLGLFGTLNENEVFSLWAKCGLLGFVTTDNVFENRDFWLFIPFSIGLEKKHDRLGYGIFSGIDGVIPFGRKRSFLLPRAGGFIALPLSARMQCKISPALTYIPNEDRFETVIDVSLEWGISHK
ncbi:MAG: hypothetical protein AAF206_11335 [Bacteroidota bacterium]